MGVAEAFFVIAHVAVAVFFTSWVAGLIRTNLKQERTAEAATTTVHRSPSNCNNRKVLAP